MLRPFYFVLVVWGEEYRNYFLKYCLPTLLAPANIPAVAKARPIKYLIATTMCDWELMSRTAIFRQLARYVTPTFIELPPCPADRPYWMQNIVGHKLLCDLVFRDKAYRIFTSPDAVFGDGAMARLDHVARSGAEVVCKLTVPIAEKDRFFRILNDMGMLPKINARDSGNPLVFSGRQIATAAIRSMHANSIVNEWQAPYFCGYASIPWWRIPGVVDGMVVCGLRWDVFLLDYAAVKSHDTSILDKRGWDGDYIKNTFGDLETIYIVRDSDDIMVAGWSSDPTGPTRRHVFGEFSKSMAFRTSYYSPSFNSLHRQLLFFPTRIHSDPTDGRWDKVESTALRTLLTCVDPPLGLGKLSRRLPPELNNYAELEKRVAALRPAPWRRKMVSICCSIETHGKGSLEDLKSLYARTSPRMLAILTGARIVIRRTGLAVMADESALEWWRSRIRKLKSIVLRRLSTNRDDQSN